MFGLAPAGPLGPARHPGLMADRVGVVARPRHLRGPDRIDPDRTLDALDRMAERMAEAARDPAPGWSSPPATRPACCRSTSRSPTGCAQAGAEVLTPAAGFGLRRDDRTGRRHAARSATSRGVAMVSNRGELNHTHSPAPMEAILARWREAGEPPPDLVVADHGWAGAAGQAGVVSVGFADSNDPALFVGEAEGTVAVAVPLDDNVAPHLYDAAHRLPARRRTPRGLTPLDRARVGGSRSCRGPEGIVVSLTERITD